jgi:predicted nucleic acid-binding protein
VIIEVQRYVPRVARKLGVEQALLEYALNLLPLRIYPARRYARAVREARRRIERRDPTDVDVLALALHLDVPLWSNDRDFEDTGVSRFTTAELLAILFEDRGH